MILCVGFVRFVCSVGWVGRYWVGSVIGKLVGVRSTVSTLQNTAAVGAVGERTVGAAA